MRSILALGVVSLAVAAGMVACGDDSGDDGPVGGRGGASGSGGGGAGGTGGGTGGTGGGTGGTSAGTGGTGGAAPMPPAATCTGCVQLTVPVGGTLPTGATNYQAGFIFSAPATDPPFDLSDVTTITWRVQALNANANYYVQPFIQNGPPENASFSGVFPGNRVLAPAEFGPTTWVDVSIDVGAAPGGPGDAGVPDAGDEGDGGVVLTSFDKAYTRSIGLIVGGLATSAVGFVSVQVDSVTVVGTSNFTTKQFAANVEGMTLNAFQAPANTPNPSFH